MLAEQVWPAVSLVTLKRGGASLFHVWESILNDPTLRTLETLVSKERTWASVMPWPHMHSSTLVIMDMTLVHYLVSTIDITCPHTIAFVHGMDHGRKC
jgi:hypothetical protein